MKRFVIGDMHFFDENIIKFTRNRFATEEVMRHSLITNWNRVVTKDDVVYLLGDVFDLNNCDESQIKETLSLLNGKIILIAGNHDEGAFEVFRKCGVEVIEYPIVVDDFFILSHKPMFVDESCPYANIFAHVHNNPMYQTISCRSYCVSAERIDYTPKQLDRIEKDIREYK